MDEADDGLDAVRDQIDLDYRGARHYWIAGHLPAPREDKTPRRLDFHEPAGGESVTANVHPEQPSGSGVDVCLDALPAQPLIAVREERKDRGRRSSHPALHDELGVVAG